MTEREIALIAAPVGMTPGGYVGIAYADQAAPRTPRATLRAEAAGDGWQVAVRWPCPQPVLALDHNPGRFVDGVALLVPAADDAQWLTMGAADAPVEGVLWQANRERPFRFRATGLGSVERGPAPGDWRADARWADGEWTVRFTLPEWAALARSRRVGVAVWQGQAGERASLKSVSPGWIDLEAAA